MLLHPSSRLSKQKEGWVKLKESPEYQKVLKDWHKLERRFVEVNKWYGFSESQFKQAGCLGSVFISYIVPLPSVFILRIVWALIALRYCFAGS